MFDMFSSKVVFNIVTGFDLKNLTFLYFLFTYFINLSFFLKKKTSLRWFHKEKIIFSNYSNIPLSICLIDNHVITETTVIPGNKSHSSLYYL